MPVIATITDPDSPAEYGGVTGHQLDVVRRRRTTVADFVTATLKYLAPAMSEHTGNVGEFLWVNGRVSRWQERHG